MGLCSVGGKKGREREGGLKRKREVGRELILSLIIDAPLRPAYYYLLPPTSSSSFLVASVPPPLLPLSISPRSHPLLRPAGLVPFAAVY